MKSLAMIGISLLALTVAGAAPAESSHTPEGAPDGPPRHHAPRGLIEADTDGDGKVSGEEFRKHHEEMFKKADTNGDGQLDRDEVLAIPRMRGGREGAIPPAPGPEWRAGRHEGGFGPGNPEQFFSTLDANDDGKLQRDELPEALAAHADRLDKDGDGAISLEEMKQARPDRETMRARIQERLKQLDKNGDGLIQRDEAGERLTAQFDRIDTNGDDALDMEELKQFRPRQMGQAKAGNPAAKTEPSSSPRVIEN